MSRKKQKRLIAPLPGGTRPTEPAEIIELYPNPLPPPTPPLSREETLACVQASFAALDDTELRVACLWLVGTTPHDISARLDLPEDTVRQVWQGMRRKVRAGLKRSG